MRKPGVKDCVRTLSVPLTNHGGLVTLATVPAAANEPEWASLLFVTFEGSLTHPFGMLPKIGIAVQFSKLEFGTGFWEYTRLPANKIHAKTSAPIAVFIAAVIMGRTN